MTHTLPKPNKKHILIVDDDEFVLRVFGGYLQNGGFELLYAHDGAEGREMARRFLPDLILLDLNMPVMDGFEVVTRLKSEELTKNIPIVVLTSVDVSKEAEKNLKELGVDKYIHKSIKSHELVDYVNKTFT